MSPQLIALLGFMLYALVAGGIIHTVTRRFAPRANQLIGGAFGLAVATAGLSHSLVAIPGLLYAAILVVMAMAGHALSCRAHQKKKATPPAAN